MVLTVGGVVGSLLTLFGAAMLVTGRAPEPTMRLFARARDAGYYHFLFGVALLVLVLGQTMLSGAAGIGVAAAAMVLAGVALVKFRPRHHGGRVGAGRKKGA